MSGMDALVNGAATGSARLHVEYGPCSAGPTRSSNWEERDTSLRQVRGASCRPVESWLLSVGVQTARDVQ